MSTFSRWFVPVLLSAVALVQMKRSLADGLTPWKGGGFGMFSTADSGATRFVRIYLEQDSDQGLIRQLVEQPNLTDAPELAELSEQLRAEPSEARTLQLARVLGAQTWHSYGESERSAMSPSMSSVDRANAAQSRILVEADARTRDLQKLARFPVVGVRLEVWRLSIDGQRDAAVTAPIASLHFDRRSGAHTFHAQEAPWNPAQP